MSKQYGAGDKEISNSRLNFIGMYAERDRQYLDTIRNLLETNKISLEQLLGNPFAFIPRRELPQFLAYAELCKKILPLPGSIVEVGVYLGNGLLTWAKLLETFIPGDRGRKVFGFDNFEGYNQDALEIDRPGIEFIQKRYGKQQDAFKVEQGTLEQLLKISNLDTFLPGVDRAVLYCGNLAENFRKFREQEMGTRISLMVVDVNLYKPTKLALEELFDLIVPNGYLVFRGYGVKPWEGESKAVDEFMQSRRGEVTTDETFPFSMYPSLVLKKE